jgi:hypothetical protein
MKKRFFLLFAAIVAPIVFHSCELIQDMGAGNISVFTVPAASITSISAISGGVVRTGGDTPVTRRGVCWSTEKGPSADLLTKTSDSTGTISFSSQLKNLLPNTLYYVRAYAANGEGVYYGNEINFKTTQPTIPSVSSVKPSLITGSTALGGGLVINDGGSPVKSRGVCWSLTENPTIYPGQMTTDSTGTGPFLSHLTGLVANKKYYLRAYAVNDIGIAYGDQINFITSPATLAIVKTVSPSELTSNTATITCNVSDDSGSPVSSRGICWGDAPEPTADKNNKSINGAGLGTFSALITGLAAGKTYYARAYAINSPGISYGNLISFTTKQAVMPSVTTILPGLISYTTSMCGGNVTGDGGAIVLSRGVCWSSSENPTIALNSKTTDGTGTGNFASLISGLKPNSNYYVRAYATNQAGTGYGNQVLLKTLATTSPLVSTVTVADVTLIGARAVGVVTSDGGEEVIER